LDSSKSVNQEQTEEKPDNQKEQAVEKKPDEYEFDSSDEEVDESRKNDFNIRLQTICNDTI